MGKPETIRKGNLGKLDLRLVKRDGQFFGLANGQIVVRGDAADDTWHRLHNEAGKTSPRYFGFDGARAKFLHFFPNGFQSDSYAHHERDYKLVAKQKLDETAPLEDAATGSGYGEAIWSVFQTNMLSPFEKMRVREVLRGSNADAFVRAAARFTMEGGKQKLFEMERALKPSEAGKWTVVTYLPFLWRPEEHMYLKPEVTKDFAERTGHRFAHDYEAKLDIKVYDSLIDMAAKTEKALADLKPRDRIDVQSFLWVIGGSYDEEPARP